MKISREGKTIIPVAALVLAALATGLTILFRWAGLGEWVATFWGVSALATWVLVVTFFRVPDRPLIEDDEVVFSPCDGTVVVCEDVLETEVSGEKRLQISIFMSITNVHVNWFPVSGKAVYFKHHHGRFLVAWHPKSSDDNEHTTTAVETPSNGTVVFRQVAGLMARRIVSYAEQEQAVVQNTPCGFIKFGSRVDLYLPTDVEVLVSLGQKVRGSQTPIARFKRK